MIRYQPLERVSLMASGLLFIFHRGERELSFLITDK